MSRITRCIAPIILFLGAGAGFSQQANKIHIHGFSSWGYARTDGNEYLSGEESGEYDYLDFAIALTVKPTEYLQIKAQLYWNDTYEAESSIDYAFAEWRFSDALRFRIGDVKHPLGIYTEFFDVGTLRPFFTLPSSIYHDTGIVAEGYKGAGLTGILQNAGGWGLRYDIYGGEFKMEIEGADVTHEGLEKTFIEGAEEDSEEEHHVKNVLGGRITIDTPVNGMNFGVSGYFGDVEGTENTHSVYGFHGELLSDQWSVRSEYYHHMDGDGEHINAFYCEASRFLGDHWQIAARGDQLLTTFMKINTNTPPSLHRHREFAASLNYWFNTYFVLKLSYHDVDGNRFARPESLDEALLDGALKERTKLFLFGAQFAF